MILHIKFLKLKYFLHYTIIFIGLVLIGCKKEEQRDNSFLIKSKKVVIKKTDESEVNTYENFIGSWIINKKIKIGKWEKDEEYYYTKEEFEKRYENLLFEISAQYITIGAPYYCSGDNKMIPESVFSITGTNQRDLDEFLQKDLNIDPNSYRGYLVLDCEYPLTKIYIFKHHLLFLEYGAFFYLLEKKDSKKITVQKECIKEDDFENVTFTEKCEYSKITDFNLLYKDMINSYKIESALNELPKKDTIRIIQFFQAGENHYSIYKKGENGVVEQVTFPD